MPAEERLPQLGDVAPDLAARLIAEGDLEVIGRLVAASNATLLCRVALPGPIEGAAIYKPVRGERALWDFPDGTLAGREMAAFLVSEATGWRIVPPTVLRDGPFGAGMVQLWMDVDESVDRVALVNGADQRLRRIAVFDAVVNNADRKVGHLLPMSDGSILGVDHGVCFHREPKLRTVLWAWRGKKLRAAETAVVEHLEADLAGDLGAALRGHLTRAEVEATRKRARNLLRSGRFPQPSADWPAIPWPPY